jgi:hypothetical protein
MIQRVQKLALPLRILVYAAVAAVVLAVAAGIGAASALLVAPDEVSSGGAKSQQAGEPKPDQASQQKSASDRQSEAEYVARIGDIQAGSVETFLDSNERFMRYDALTADDVQKMKANQAALKGFANQVDSLDPPQKYREQHEVFRSAINELYEATKLAYALAADPTAATTSEFEEYDRHVNQAAADLKRSNEILGRDYETIEGARMEEIGSF